MLLELLDKHYEKVMVLGDENLVDIFKDVDYIEEHRYSKINLPLNHYDLIIGSDIFEGVGDCLDMAAGLSQYLKTTGDLISCFNNLRYWKCFLNLFAGRLNPTKKYFTRDSFRRMMTAAFYKSFEFMAETKKAPPRVLERLINAGIENSNDDLECVRWYFRASRSSPETYQLKQIGTQDFRDYLSKIILRIEYGIELENSIAEFNRLSAEVFPEYINDFIDSIVMHREQFYSNLASRQF